MKKIILILLMALSVATLCVHAGEENKSPEFQVLPGQRFLLSGDSIAKGLGFGNYTNPSPLRTLYGIGRIILNDNLKHAPQFLYLPGVWEGLNPDGTPKTVDSLAGEIQVYVKKGDIRTGDWLIYEDAGGIDNFVHPAPWPNTNNMYLRYREALRGMVLEAQSTVDRHHIRLMTMFDYHAKVPWASWDAPLDDGVHSGNDAIRDEAAALGVTVIDMNRIMDRAEEFIVKGKWGRLVGPDGVHPNIYGNLVMTLAILESLGGDIANWKLDGLYSHFKHPEAGGDVQTVWGFMKDPTDGERVKLIEDLRGIVVRETKEIEKMAAKKSPMSEGVSQFYPTSHTFKKMTRYGRVLDHPVAQPENTTKPASYEIAKIFQLDKETAILIASLREQGGHDFEIGNDGVIFRKLSDIVPERAFPINRLQQDYTTKAGQKAVLAKYSVSGMIIPLGAKLENGAPHPAAGTGFLLSTVLSFTPDRSEVTRNADQFVELYQVRWDGKDLKVEKDALPEPFASDLINVGFNCISKGETILCPVVAAQGIEVLLFEHKNGRWLPTSTGGIFSVTKKTAKIAAETVGSSTKQFAVVRGEIEPSMVKWEDGYVIHTRGSDVDPTGRLYWSRDGLRYYLKSEHWNHTVPQILNQGLDGELYLITNIGPGLLRNPLYCFALRGLSFVDPIIVHDEKQVRLTKGKEIPFCDHGMAESIFLEGRWHHFLTYRVLDLKETNGEGAPPAPQTGLYLAEFEYDHVTHVPHQF